jgi:CRISPR-associated endonuclease Csn1
VGGRNVRCVKGGTTNELRWQWGLTGLWANADERDADHRRHAVDAVVVALTSRAALQRLSAVKYSPDRAQLDPPWEGFRDDVRETWTGINVSFRPTRKLAGGLHDATGLGPVKDMPQTFVHRVPVESLTVAMVSQIRDPVIRQIVEDRCREHHIDLEGSGKIEKAVWNPMLTMPPSKPEKSGVPIKRVRIQTTEKTAIAIRKEEGRTTKVVLPGGNHHVEIHELPEGKWTGRCVSRFESHQLLRQGVPIVNRKSENGLRFVMSLCINDVLQITDAKTGEVRLYRVQKMSSGVPMMELRFHTASRIDDKATRFLIATWDKLRSLNAQKVIVDPIGRVFPCND